MTPAPNPPVLIGIVPLLYVQSITISEGYEVRRIADSPFSQALAPTRKTIALEAVLLGADRLRIKKELEALALVSRVLAAAAAPKLRLSGIPVVCGLTVSLDMQITELRFTQSTQRRAALDLSMSLQHVPRSSTTLLIGEAADIALAAGVPLVSAPAAGSPLPRVPSVPLRPAG
ncbi:hypothetical protein [Streptomyces sp. NPDC056468]|uniref:hypothetical protein n=1 Tax=Streptomyces sp. NPDC056468 TaxID=3345830 RepID=UPI0036BFD36B